MRLLSLASVDLKKKKIDTIVIPVCEDRNILADKMLSDLAAETVKKKEFSGKESEELVLFDLKEPVCERAIFLGMGKADKVALETLRTMAGRAVKKCIKSDLKTVLLATPSSEELHMNTSDMLEAILEGACLGNHLFDRYKSEKKKKPLAKIDLQVPPAEAKKFRALPGRVRTICQGTVLARDWVSIPSIDKKPDKFCRDVATLARKANLAVTALNEKELKSLKFGSLLAVSAGSDSPPRLLILEHRPKAARRTVALVGKGVTFDSGGINLKPSGSLEEMKMDMAGAAAVAATMLTISKLNLKVNVIGAIPLVENMPSGKATRPGDIITSHAGKTVEIGNTDAEGRLILIDTIAYVLKKYKPETLIDLATLTGACIMALGEKIAGLFSHRDDLAEEILASSRKTHERCWRLPLPEDYKELIKSDFADIKNMSSSKWGGAITAALFLSEFVGETPWAHIDIAGPAYTKKENAYGNAGGTGFGVRLLCDYLSRLQK